MIVVLGPQNTATFGAVRGYIRLMRVFLAVLATAGALFALVSVPASAQPAPPAQRALRSALGGGMRAAGRFSGALVTDLNTGATLFSVAPGVGRLPASVEKLYTTATALMRFGPNATLQTQILGVG